MPTATKINIISRAFVLLGNRAINSLDETDPNIIIAEDLYETFLPILLQKTWWQFARRTQILDQLSTKPNESVGYEYAYQLPTDPKELLLFKIYPQSSDYRLYTDKLYSNESSITLDYIYQVAENKFPPHFTLSLIYQLAAGLATPVTQNFQIAQFFDLKASKQLLHALAVEGSNEPSEQIRQDPILEAHLNG